MALIRRVLLKKIQPLVAESREGPDHARCAHTFGSWLRKTASRARWSRPCRRCPGGQLSILPRYIPSGDVERAIACCGDHPAGVRDRAILLLLARLALRAGDIVALRLGDIDWDRA